MKTTINLILVVLLCSCSTGYKVKLSKPPLVERLREIKSTDIDLNEATVIMQSFSQACYGSTAFKAFSPVKYKNLWLGPVIVGDAVPMYTAEPIVFNTETGVLEYQDIKISHFSRIFEECERRRVQTTQ